MGVTLEGVEVDWTAVGTLVAALATAVAAIAAWRAADQSRTITELESERRAEEQRAQLACRVVGQYVSGNKRHALVIWNRGPSTATDLRIKVDPLPRNLELNRVPPILGPGLIVELAYQPLPAADDPDRRTTIWWTDGAGERHQLEVPPQWVRTPSPLTSEDVMSDLAWRLAP